MKTRQTKGRQLRTRTKVTEVVYASFKQKVIDESAQFVVIAWVGDSKRHKEHSRETKKGATLTKECEPNMQHDLTSVISVSSKRVQKVGAFIVI
jgi:hypothetical protein